MRNPRIIPLLLGLCLSPRALASTPEGDSALFQQSYDDEATGRFEDGLAAIDHLTDAKRASYVAQLRRGWLLYRLGRYATSIEAYQHASDLAPHAVEPRVGALLPLMAERRWSTAEKTAREVLRSDPGNYLAGLRLAYIDYNQGQYAESLALYKKLAEAYPSDVEVRSGLGWALVKLGRANEAAAEFREVLDVAPKNASALQGLTATGATR